TVAPNQVTEHLNNRRIVINDQDAPPARFELLQWDVIGLHETNQGIAGDPAKLRAGDAESLQPAVVETSNHGLLAYPAYLGVLAGGEDLFDAQLGLRPVENVAHDGSLVLMLTGAHLTHPSQINNAASVIEWRRGQLNAW